MRLGDLWRGRGRTIPPDPDYPTLDGVIKSCLHQDMDLFHETISDAIAEWATLAEPQQRAMLIQDIDRFLAREAAEPDVAFVRRWGFDINPPDMGRSSSEFLNAARAIAVDPAAASGSRGRW
ncbi:contact-dependent growth inhibition system immunity protein [Sphingomonas sp.]|uniref:contact-dependent growth inhibition system immunity protein n=1 Tax=Sphingomonas sp. TaxID=28214 RepID=UPI003B3A0A4B